MCNSAYNVTVCGVNQTVVGLFALGSVDSPYKLPLSKYTKAIRKIWAISTIETNPILMTTNVAYFLFFLPALIIYDCVLFFMQKYVKPVFVMNNSVEA